MPNQPVSIRGLEALDSYTYVVEVEVEGSTDLLSSLGEAAFFASEGSLNLRVAGAYVKPDKAQYTMTIGDSIEVTQTVVDNQVWTEFGGLTSGPEPADFDQDLSLADNLVEDYVGRSCSGQREDVNGVSTQKCGLDFADLGFFSSSGFPLGDSSILVQGMETVVFQLWVSDQGQVMRLLGEIKGTDSGGEAFRLYVFLELDDVGSDLEIVPPTSPTGIQAATPTAALSEPPQGWSSFEEGPYSGFAKDDWFLIYLDSDAVKSLSEKSTGEIQAETGLSAGVIERVRLASRTLTTEALLVLVTPEEELTTNIMIFGCVSEADVPPPGLEVLVMQSALGGQASLAGQISFRGQSYNLVKGTFQGFDVYQAYPKVDDTCSLVVQLGAASGDTRFVQDFRDFVGSLEVTDIDRIRIRD